MTGGRDRPRGISRCRVAYAGLGAVEQPGVGAPFDHLAMEDIEWGQDDEGGVIQIGTMHAQVVECKHLMGSRYGADTTACATGIRSIPIVFILILPFAITLKVVTKA